MSERSLSDLIALFCHYGLDLSVLAFVADDERFARFIVTDEGEVITMRRTKAVLQQALKAIYNYDMQIRIGLTCMAGTVPNNLFVFPPSLEARAQVPRVQG